VVKKNTRNITPASILEEIYMELRGIVRQRSHLRRPIDMFMPIKSVPEGQPRFRVVFDTCPPKIIRGLKIPGTKLKLPDEKIADDVINYAKSVWHLKDRLKIWTKLNECNLDIEKYAEKNINLMVCADLANKKKHGCSSNRSGFDPSLNIEIEFDTSKNGLLELFYKGSLREKELLVSIPVTCSPKTVPVESSGSYLLAAKDNSL
jgi:hypothetical protein